jgi:hypothetical protein
MLSSLFNSSRALLVEQPMKTGTAFFKTAYKETALPFVELHFIPYYESRVLPMIHLFLFNACIIWSSLLLPALTNYKTYVFGLVPLLMVFWVVNVCVFWSYSAIPKELPWVGQDDDHRPFFRIRSAFKSIFHTRELLDEGYAKVITPLTLALTHANKCFIVLQEWPHLRHS